MKRNRQKNADTKSTYHVSTFLSELGNECLQVEDEIDDFKFYPVISFGISYKF